LLLLPDELTQLALLALLLLPERNQEPMRIATLKARHIADFF